MGCAQSLLKLDADLEQLYTLDKLIGEGVEGVVHLATCNTTGDKVAIKLVARGPDLGLGPEKVRREIQLQARLSHVNIVELKQVVLTRRHLGIVMSYVAGGDLHSYCTRFKLDETVARYFFRQIVEGLHYCHCCHVAHRDLKLSNFLLTTDKPPRLKLADFGCARQWDHTNKDVPKQRMRRFRTYAGTPAYMSPQVLQSAFYPTNTYDAVEADVWALGIVLCHLFFGAHTPYWLTPNAFRNEGLTMQARIQAMKEQNWVDSDEFVKANVKALSPELRDLLDKIFVADEFKRITMQGIKEHPWYQMPLPPLLQNELDEMAKEQELRDSLERATVSVAANRHDTAEPDTGEFATIDLLVDLAQKHGKMPGGSLDKVFCLDMAHMDLGPLAMSDTLMSSLPESPTSAAAVDTAVVAVPSPFAAVGSAAGSDTATGTDLEGTQHSTASHADSLHRAASAGDRSNHLNSVSGAPQLTSGRFKKTLSLKTSSSGLLVGKYVLEPSDDDTAHGPSTGMQGWLSGIGSGQAALKKARSVHAGRAFFNEASHHHVEGREAIDAGGNPAGGEPRGNRTVHGGTEHAAMKAASGQSRDTYYRG